MQLQTHRQNRREKGWNGIPVNLLGTNSLEVEGLLGAIYTTLGIQADKKPLSLHDQMYQGLEQQQGRVFLVHEVLVEAIKKECQDLEGKPFFSRALKVSLFRAPRVSLEQEYETRCSLLSGVGILTWPSKTWGLVRCYV